MEGRVPGGEREQEHREGVQEDRHAAFGEGRARELVGDRAPRPPESEGGPGQGRAQERCGERCEAQQAPRRREQQEREQREAAETARENAELAKEEADLARLQVESTAYTFLIRMAKNAWEAGEQREALEYLSACPENLRGWEWEWLSAMHNSALINIHMVHQAANSGAQRYFFSSSACVYHDMTVGDSDLSEDEAYPAQPDNEYGWEKLYAERMAMTYGRHFGMAVRIARFQNCYGPQGTWQGGREKAPAALSRKIAASDGSIEVWGDGSASRAYTYVDDMVAGIYLLMQSDCEEPLNIGRREYVSVDELASTIADVAGKKIAIEHIDGPVGVKARNFTNDKITALGWKSQFSLREGIARTYPWIKEQAEAADA